MEYTKQPITLAEQINILKQRGLTFEDENAALRILSQISYFRLASYWRVMGFYEAPPRLLVATGGGEFFFKQVTKL